MLGSTLIIFLVLGGKPASSGCLDRCSSQMSRCADPCGDNQSCMDKCNRNSQRCTSGCAASEEGAHQKAAEKSQKLPCGINEQTGAVIPCTEKEEREMKESTMNIKGLCKDEEGLPIACPGEREKLKAKLKKMGIELDCTDASGMPIECPGNKR